MTESYTLVLAKEDFKFSSAHFTLFSAETAEHLHGHNYQVQVEIVGRELDEEGLLVGFAEVKGAIRALCQAFDSRTLVPTRSPHLEIERREGNVAVRFRSRSYSFPEEDVVLLPTVNTSIELLARHLWRELARALPASGTVEGLGVNVRETAGQGCWYRAPLTQTSGTPEG